MGNSLTAADRSFAASLENAGDFTIANIKAYAERHYSLSLKDVIYLGFPPSDYNLHGHEIWRSEKVMAWFGRLTDARIQCDALEPKQHLDELRELMSRSDDESKF